MKGSAKSDVLPVAGFDLKCRWVKKRGDRAMDMKREGDNNGKTGR